MGRQRWHLDASVLKKSKTKSKKTDFCGVRQGSENLLEALNIDFSRRPECPPLSSILGSWLRGDYVQDTLTLRKRGNEKSGRSSKSAMMDCYHQAAVVNRTDKDQRLAFPPSH